jgi:uncharacterized membrane protein YccF (DUF307 family)
VQCLLDLVLRTIVRKTSLIFVPAGILTGDVTTYLTVVPVLIILPAPITCTSISLAALVMVPVGNTTSILFIAPVVAVVRSTISLE